MEMMETILRWATCAAVSIGSVELLSLGSLTGAKLVAGFIVDDGERAKTSATMFWLIVLASCAATIVFWREVPFAAVFTGCALIVWMIRMRRERFFGKPDVHLVKGIVRVTKSKVVIAALYTLLVPLVMLEWWNPSAFVVGYLAGLLLIACLRPGFQQSDTERNARTAWISLAVSTIMAAVMLILLLPIPSALSLTLRSLAALSLIAGVVGFCATGRFRDLLSLLPALLMWISSGIPTRYAEQAASVVLFVIFLIWQRKNLYEAFLPMRAKWIRMKANRR